MIAAYDDYTLKLLEEKILYSVVPHTIEYSLVSYSEPLTGNWLTNNTHTERNIYDKATGRGILYLNDGVTSIGGETWSTNDSPFIYRTDVISVDLSNSGLVDINTATFGYCESLTSINISDGVTKIGKRVFEGCSKLTSIVVDSMNSIYDSRNSCNAIIETATNTLIVGCVNTVIPNSVTKIGEYAFYGCSSITSINIPDSVTKIDRYAFSYCSALTSVTCLATNPPTLGIDNFTAENDTLYVPSESVSTYKSNNKWSTAFTTITAINN